MGFIDTMRGEGFAVESICAVLREQGAQVAARTYRKHRRLHSTLGMITPAEAEAAHYAATTAPQPEPQPA
jgi:putative transposase